MVEIIEVSWSVDDVIYVGSREVRSTVWIEALDKRRSQQGTNNDWLDKQDPEGKITCYG